MRIWSLKTSNIEVNYLESVIFVKKQVFCLYVSMNNLQRIKVTQPIKKKKVKYLVVEDLKCYFNELLVMDILKSLNQKCNARDIIFPHYWRRLLWLEQCYFHLGLSLHLYFLLFIIIIIIFFNAPIIIGYVNSCEKSCP